MKLYKHYVVPVDPLSRDLLSQSPMMITFTLVPITKTPEIVNYHSTTTNTTQPKNPTET